MEVEHCIRRISVEIRIFFHPIEKKTGQRLAWWKEPIWTDSTKCRTINPCKLKDTKIHGLIFDRSQIKTFSAKGLKVLHAAPKCYLEQIFYPQIPRACALPSILKRFIRRNTNSDWIGYTRTREKEIFNRNTGASSQRCGRNFLASWPKWERNTKR